MSFALAWCGWEVRAFDIELGTDLAGDKHAELWQLRGEVLARAWACPCSTFSRAREKPLAYSSDGGPPQLRSIEQPKGLPGLSSKDQARVDMDTTLACRSAEWAEHSLSDDHTLTLIENPRHSLLWALPEQQRLQQHDSWCSVDYDACCFQGARKKAQTIRGNTSLLSQLAAKCSHVHDPDEWRRTKVFATTEEKEYTAHFAYSLAICIAAWAVQRRGVPLRIPRALPPRPSGTRQGWASMDPRATREWAMVSTGVRLGLEPPEQRPADWYPAFAAADMIAWRGCPECEIGSELLPDRCQLSDARPKMPADLYIGRGESSGPYTEPSKWGNPFRVSRFGRKAALTKYRDYILKSPLLGQLSELRGRNLLCTCPSNQPCHGDVLIDLFQKHWASRPSVYIGAGSRANKRRTIWASPFLPGDKYTYEECALRYRRWLHQEDQSWLRQRLGELMGRRLICECPSGEACHGDVLAQEVEKLARAASRDDSCGRRTLQQAASWSDSWPR